MGYEVKLRCLLDSGVRQRRAQRRTTGKETDAQFDRGGQIIEPSGIPGLFMAFEREIQHENVKGMVTSLLYILAYIFILGCARGC